MFVTHSFTLMVLFGCAKITFNKGKHTDAFLSWKFAGVCVNTHRWAPGSGWLGGAAHQSRVWGRDVVQWDRRHGKREPQRCVAGCHVNGCQGGGLALQEGDKSARSHSTEGLEEVNRNPNVGEGSHHPHQAGMLKEILKD